MSIDVATNTIQRLKNELILNKEKFNHVIDKAIIAICITDHEGYYVYVNDSYCKLYEYTREELIGIHFSLVVLPENKEILQNLHNNFIAGGAEPRGEWQVVTRTGELKTILADAARISDDEGQPQKVTYIMDITKRKQQEVELEKAYKHIMSDVEKANMILQQFMPYNLPPQMGLQFTFYNQPAVAVGGDFVMVKRIDDTRLLISMIDVSGHGLDAALLNIFVKNTIEHYIYNNQKSFSLSTLMEFVYSRFVEQNFPEEYYICMLTAIYDATTHQLHVINAGIQIPLYYVSDGFVTPMLVKGMPVSSFIPEQLVAFSEASYTLEEGSKVIFASDGLIELTNESEEMYGLVRLEKVLKQTASNSEDVLQAIVTSYKAFANQKKSEDDITILIIQRDRLGIKN